ncbi:hypothetical protein GWI33_006448 [Rhynchophorus ferrugineus]|uniref:Uncharacterized protein n=1 Tax=Rhynchophorus ferrugineus TaxID=354439 RepID=A0A834MHC2_RHYFE|nr:hypothetical protein GWI33_006448 [Rhynchophorus ferrugineus]
MEVSSAVTEPQPRIKMNKAFFPRGSDGSELRDPRHAPPAEPSTNDDVEKKKEQRKRRAPVPRGRLADYARETR